MKRIKIFALMSISFVICLFIFSCTEDETEAVRIGNAGKLVVTNLTSNDVLEREMYGQDITNPQAAINVDFDTTMYVRNGDKLRFTFQPNSQCSKYDLKPVLVVSDTSVTLTRPDYSFDYVVEKFERSERYGALLFIYFADNPDKASVFVCSVADLALALRDEDYRITKTDD